ncbi:hypothetical protein BDW60DRAFT_201916, partial [Aspergillus nidulans var. acristatus]
RSQSPTSQRLQSSCKARSCIKPAQCWRRARPKPRQARTKAHTELEPARLLLI